MNYLICAPAFVAVTPIPASELADSIGHFSAMQSTTLLIHQAGADRYDLRLVGNGEQAYYEWTDRLGDPVRDAFNELDPEPATELGRLHSILSSRAIAPSF